MQHDELIFRLVQTDILDRSATGSKHGAKKWRVETPKPVDALQSLVFFVAV